MKEYSCKHVRNVMEKHNKKDIIKDKVSGMSSAKRKCIACRCYIYKHDPCTMLNTRDLGRVFFHNSCAKDYINKAVKK